MRKPISRITDPNVFYEEFFLKNVPVVVEGAARQMPAFSLWSFAYLATHLAGQRPMVRFEDGTFGKVPIGVFFDYLLNHGNYHSSHGLMYMTDFYLDPSFDDTQREMLAKEAAFPLRRNGLYAEWTSLYAGPPGTSTKWHQDIFSTNTWLASIKGTKHWTLCEPTIDPLSLNEESSLFYEALLAPGDLIFLPPDWWHQVENQTTTISVSGNFCSFEKAFLALKEAEQSDSPHRENWVKTWRQILKKAPLASETC